MSRFLITGAAGFIGSRVADLLLRQGHVVHAVDNLDEYYDVRLKIWRLKQLAAHSKFTFDRCDIEEQEQISYSCTRLGPVDAVIHLAAKAGVRSSVSNPRAYYGTNLLGTLNVLETCRQLCIPKLVIASSSSVYGDSHERPYREDAPTSRPLSPYAASKKATEDLCFSYHHLHALDVSALRFFTVYGPAGRPDMGVFRFIRGIVEGEPLTLFGNGEQSRDFSYVDDIAQGIILSLKRTGFRVFNLGANRPVTVNSAIGIIQKLSGKDAIIRQRPVNASDVSDTWADVTRAAEELSWQPSTSIETGLEHAFRWYMENRSWAKNLTDNAGAGTASQLVALSAATQAYHSPKYDQIPAEILL